MNTEIQKEDIKKFVHNFNIEEAKDRRYWMIRTKAGAHYEAFKNGGYIAINWNEITLSDINGIDRDNSEDIKKVAQKVVVPEDSKDPNYGTRAVKQVIRFVKDIKKGDIVIIPDEGSKLLTIGIVENTITQTLDGNLLDCVYRKRKKVRWINTFDRYKLDANFFRFIHAQKTVNNLDEYGYYIEKTLFPVFMHKGKAHYVFNVTRSQDIYNSHFYALLTVSEIASGFLKEECDINIGEASIKTNVQSPGSIVMVAFEPQFLLVMSIAMIAICGGKLSIERIGLKLEMKGLRGWVSEFLNEKQKRKSQETVRKKIEELNPQSAEACEQLVKVLLEAHDSSKT